LSPDTFQVNSSEKIYSIKHPECIQAPPVVESEICQMAGIHMPHVLRVSAKSQIMML